MLILNVNFKRKLIPKLKFSFFLNLIIRETMDSLFMFKYLLIVASILAYTCHNYRMHNKFIDV